MNHETTAYHTVEYRGEENRNNICSDAPFKCCKVNAWLSSGYYFWDQDLERAKEWGEKSYRNKYIVLECDLKLDNLFDIVGSRKHQMELQELNNIIKGKFSRDVNVRIPISKIITYLRILNGTDKKGVFEYDSMKAEDHPNRISYSFIGSPSAMDLNSRIQICVFDKTNSKIPRTEIVHVSKF